MSAFLLLIPLFIGINPDKQIVHRLPAPYNKTGTWLPVPENENVKWYMFHDFDGERPFFVNKIIYDRNKRPTKREAYLLWGSPHGKLGILQRIELGIRIKLEPDFEIFVHGKDKHFCYWLIERRPTKSPFVKQSDDDFDEISELDSE